MNICLVTNLYPPVQTGSSYYAYDLARSLGQRGHGVFVITCAPGRFSTEEIDDEGVVVFRLPSLPVPRLRSFLGFDEFRVALYPGNLNRMTSIMREHRIDLVHQSGHLLDLTYSSLVAARRAGVPIACSVHTIIHQPAHPRLEQLAAFVDRNVVGRVAMNRFDCLFTLDAEIERYVADRYRPRAVRRVPWGISFDFDRYERHPGSSGPLKIVSLGHVTEMRSRASLIEAVAMLRDEGTAFELLIVGKLCTSAPQQHVAELGLDEHVVFTGELPRDRVLEELAGADVEAHFITNPGVGSASMEAMAVGLPTMLWASPDTLGFAELRHLDNAILVDPSDPATIAALLRKLDEDRDLLERIGRNGRRTAMESFAWPSVAASMEGIYGSVIADAQ